MNVNSIAENSINTYQGSQQESLQSKKLENSPHQEVQNLQNEKLENVQSRFGYEALNKSLENDPIAQFISYLV